MPIESKYQLFGTEDVMVNRLCIDSRIAEQGDMFIALKGTNSDGHSFIEEVVAKGVKVIVCEDVPAILNADVTYLKVSDSAKAAGEMAAAFYGSISEKLIIVGITGTNGKTTCATLLYDLFSDLGYQCGLISTVCNKIGKKELSSSHTTPDVIQLHALLAMMYDAGCTHVFMEVSSHAIHQQRIAGVNFRGACFTNITHDHLDYHKTFDEYIRVKKSYFDHLTKGAFALVNSDDKRGLVMVQNTKAKVKTYSLRNISDYKGKVLENLLSGLEMRINQFEVFLQMIGEFNAYNVLCVYGVAVELGESPDKVLQVLSMLKGAKGRFDYIKSAQKSIIAIVDYAHTPDALLNVLTTIKSLRKGTEQIITVVGCGGDRDALKRPVMGLVACEHSDKVIFTSDNPRTESPDVIIKQMEEGVKPNHKKKYLCIVDRREAIKTACSLAESNDIVLVAGKGHETYQEINGVKYAFDDKEMVSDFLNLLEK